MTTLSRTQILQEAVRRGLVTPEKAAVIKEAERRGLLQGAGTKVAQAGTAATFIDSLKEGILEIGPGLGELAAGAFQRGAELAGREDLSRKVGAQVAREREGLTTAQKIGRGAGQIIGTAPVGAGLGALKGAALAGGTVAGLTPTQEGTLEAAAKQAAIGAATSVATAGALRGLGKTAKGVKKLVKKEVNPKVTSDDLRNIASATYKEANDKGGVLRENVTNKFINNVKKLTPQTKEARLLTGDDSFTKLVNDIDQLKNRKISLQAAQEIDEILGDRIDSLVDKTTGKLTKEGFKMQKIQDAFRKSIEDVKAEDVVGTKEGFEALKRGRKIWAKSAKLRDIEKIITRAELSDNPATAIKSGFRTLISNPNRLRGFSAQEKKLIKEAAQTGVVGDTLRTFGSRLIPIGTFASGSGIASTTMSQAASSAIRNASSRSQILKADKVAEEIVKSALPQKASKAIINEKTRRIVDLLTKGAAVGSSSFVTNQ